MVLNAGIPPCSACPRPARPLPCPCCLMLVSRRVLIPIMQSPSGVRQPCVGCACLSGWLRCVCGLGVPRGILGGAAGRLLAHHLLFPQLLGYVALCTLASAPS